MLNFDFAQFIEKGLAISQPPKINKILLICKKSSLHNIEGQAFCLPLFLHD